MSAHGSGHAETEAAANELCASLSAAWSYLHLLEGMHEGAKANPQVEAQFPRVLHQLYRAAFDALFAKMGTILDRTKGTKSLPSFVTLVTRHFKCHLADELCEVNSKLARDSGSFTKIRAWRHEAVAHRVEPGGAEAFYAKNRMRLPEVRAALAEIERLFNLLTVSSLGIHNETESGTAEIESEARRLLSSLASSLAASTAPSAGVA